MQFSPAKIGKKCSPKIPVAVIAPATAEHVLVVPRRVLHTARPVSAVILNHDSSTLYVSLLNI